MRPVVLGSVALLLAGCLGAPAPLPQGPVPTLPVPSSPFTALLCDDGQLHPLAGAAAATCRSRPRTAPRPR